MLRNFPDERKSIIDPGLLDTAAAGERISAADWVEADLVRTALGEKGLPPGEPREIRPTVEDAFVAMVRADKGVS